MSEVPETFVKRSFQFACQIIRLFQVLSKMPGVPAHIARQVLRAGTSIGANLEEAKAGQSRRDARSKFAIALKEARETKYWLRLLRATELAPPNLLEPTLAEADELVAILTVAVRRMAGG
jgi:four helix bundle protein